MRPAIELRRLLDQFAPQARHTKGVGVQVSGNGSTR